MNANTAVPESAAILVVDDAPINIGVAAESLESEGFRVFVALDGEEALERAPFSQPDLILLDVKMAGIDGFETCRRLKRDERTRDIPVIFMTSLADATNLVEGFSAGGIDYVTKPFQITEMMARIRTHLALRAMHRQLQSQNEQLSSEVAIRQQAQEALSRARDELEQRVAERTSQLLHANASLSVEIDEHRYTEAKLAASEARFRTIVETVPVPLCITSLDDGRVLYMNGPLRRMFGIGESERGVQYFGEFYADPAERANRIDLLHAGGGLTSGEVQFRDAHGNTFWAVSTARLATFEDAPAIYVGFNDVTERRRVEQELRESREQMRELSAYMEAVREEERKRIAMEIHDELGQLLTALKMDVSLLRMRLGADSEAVRKTDDMRELVEKTIWMVRNVSSHLRPAALNFGVVSAIEWLVDDFVQRNRVPCELSIEGSEPVLPDAHATAVFRIAQASLTNIARHARASQVNVTLTGESGALVLTIRDDGGGFDLDIARRSYSYGLLGMSERARLIGGTLTIDSAPGAGTLVSIHVPLDNGNRP
ncbi:MAG TPA: response regulator [Paraburkholderia sp.]|jgi:PAS domain S-box-containing protein|nr:response regulator [Paraburkholderia sp.]